MNSSAKVTIAGSSIVNFKNIIVMFKIKLPLGRIILLLALFLLFITTVTINRGYKPILNVTYLKLYHDEDIQRIQLTNVSESQPKESYNWSSQIPNPGSTRGDYLNATIFRDIDDTLERIFDITKKKNAFIIISSDSYDIVAVNWICNLNKNVPELLNQVILVNTDEPHSKYFHSKGINSIYLKIGTIFKSNRITRESVWMARTLLVHYILLKGWNVMIIDADAIVLKDPFHWFEDFDYDIVLGSGNAPGDIYKKWGFTGCAGTAIYRSSPKTGFLFDELGKRPVGEINDQRRLNRALYLMNMSWTNQGSTHVGISQKYSTYIAIVGEELICRHRCAKVDLKSLLISHPFSQQIAGAKMKSASSHSVLLINEEKVTFESASETATTEWLKTVCSSR